MDVFRPSLLPHDSDGGVPALDPRLQPTPDYGTLGPGSDFAPKPVQAPSDRSEQDRRTVSNLRHLHIAAVMAGIGLAVAVSSAGGGNAVWQELFNQFPWHKNPGVSSTPLSDRDLDRQKPQIQAEILLERAVARSDGSADPIAAQIAARTDAWRGKLKWDARLSELTTAALSSNHRSVRDSAIEVQLAAYGLAKNLPTVDALIQQAGSPDHAQEIWAFWSLGLLANRGIETDRVVQVLAAHLKDSGHGSDNKSEDSHRWAVEGLALVGTTPTIAPLLVAMHNDPSAVVRERAACSLAESGMFTHDQRLIAVPQLINYSDDPGLDAQTRGWAFQALADITKQRLPNDTAAWRSWYQTSVGSGQ
jgi:hypothetical protein